MKQKKNENITKKESFFVEHTVDTLTKTIEIKETEKKPNFCTLKKIHLKAAKAEFFEVRKIVSDMLDKASKSLPKGYQFMLFETYRSEEKQISLWNIELEKNKQKYPEKNKEELDEITNLVIANPYKVGSGHQTGGAIDITLCYNGYPIDMGSKYLETDNPKTKTDSEGLTPEQKKNRELLVSTLAKVGLVNYPLEWWHFSYGEHEWAVLTNQKSTLFAKTKRKLFKNECFVHE